MSAARPAENFRPAARPGSTPCPGASTVRRPNSVVRARLWGHPRTAAAGGGDDDDSEAKAGDDPKQSREVVQELLEGAPADWAALPTSRRRKRLLRCDMDSTIITVECVDELADFAGVKGRVAEITRRAMDGELDFAAALRERVALLAGLPRQAIEEVIRGRLRLMPVASQ